MLYIKLNFSKTQEHPHQPTPVPLRLDVVCDVPDVSCHGVGTSLQVPCGQGQLDAELLHVGGLSNGCQSVGATAQQEVTEGSLSRGHVGRQEGALHL